MTIEIDEAIKRYTSNAEYERTHGNLQGCLEFRQLAEWLRDYKRLKEQESKTEKVIKMRDATPEEQGAIAKYIKSISKPTGIEFDIDIDKKVESYGKLLKHPVVKHIMDEEQEQLDFVQPHKKIPVTLTVSDDLISREAVLDTISELNAISFYEAQEDSKECYYELRQAIKDLSPVKLQEPKTGHWIEENMFDGDVAYRCSECNELFWIESGTPKDNEYNFCPKCGKRLVEPQESEG